MRLNNKKHRFTFGEVQEDVGGAVGLLQVVQDGGGARRSPWVSVCVDAPQRAALRHAAELRQGVRALLVVAEASIWGVEGQHESILNDLLSGSDT